MASELPLKNCGFYFDDLNKIRVLDPGIAQQSIELKEECKDFLDKIKQFQSIADGFIGMVEKLGEEVEKEKMKAIGARNMLQSCSKQREAKQQQLQALIMEKKMELERLRIQRESLLRTESDQQEMAEHLIQKK